MAPTFVQRVVYSLVIASAVTQSQAGTISHARLHTKRAPAPLLIANDLPGKWLFSSCYTDSVQQRTLSGSVYTSGDSMTQESCIVYCSNLNYGYAGTEYAGECYCGSSIQSTGQTASLADCNMGCNGNNTEACGGPNRMSLFYNNATMEAPATTNPGTSTGWKSVGCFSDGGPDARTLTYAQGVPAGPNGMTVEACTSACQAGGHSLAGVEYAVECYCGNEFSNGGGKPQILAAACHALETILNTAVVPIVSTYTTSTIPTRLRLSLHMHPLLPPQPQQHQHQQPHLQRLTGRTLDAIPMLPTLEHS